jgi:predicted transcriptional regulator
VAHIRKTRADHATPTSVRALAGENGRVWEMYVRDGLTQREISNELGISQQRVSQIVAAVREGMPPVMREQIVLDRVNQLRELMQPFIRATLLGDNISARTLMKMLDREARYLGLDAPISLRAAIGALGDEPTRYILDMSDEIREALS